MVKQHHNLTCLEAAKKALEIAGEPKTVGEIWDIIQKEKLWKSKKGLTPDATVREVVYSYSENGRRSSPVFVGEESAKGKVFGLIEWKSKPIVRKILAEAVESLTGNNPSKTTTNIELRDWILKHYPKTNRRTIDAHRIMCTVNHASRLGYNQNKDRDAGVCNDKRYDILYRPKRGIVCRYDPEHHGYWEIVREPGKKPLVREVSVHNPSEALRVAQSTMADSPSTKPAGTKEPSRKEVKSDQIQRDLNVMRWILQEAQGKCELCNEKAPFTRKDGSPYLEVHHVKRLADGGPDTPENTVALCPNCHKALHHSNAADKLRNDIYNQVKRLDRST